YFPTMAMQFTFGNWDRSLGTSPLLSSCLSHIISSNNLTNLFVSFLTSCLDTGWMRMSIAQQRLLLRILVDRL
ncbi:hypothetical protein BDP27DRAFT_1219321, partial [Rhodocollybia butyracea]